MAASGWFKDPYGRHEARWMSGSTPTSLVRDGTVESTDPPPEAMRGDVAVALETEPGVEADHHRPSKRRGWALWLIVLGVLAIVGGNHLIKTPSLPSQRFVPSPADLAVVSKGGTAAPPGCSDSAASSAPDYALGVGPGDADTQFNVYPDTVILVFGTEEYSPELSAPSPACALYSDGFGPSATAYYYLERPGKITVYFIDRAAQVSVVRIDVTSSSPPATLPGWVLILLGGLACVGGVVLWYRRRDRYDNNALRRADDAERTGPFDPQKAQRAAWDALDQSSGQW